MVVPAATAAVPAGARATATRTTLRPPQECQSLQKCPRLRIPNQWEAVDPRIPRRRGTVQLPPVGQPLPGAATAAAAEELAAAANQLALVPHRPRAQHQGERVQFLVEAAAAAAAVAQATATPQVKTLSRQTTAAAVIAIAVVVVEAAVILLGSPPRPKVHPPLLSLHQKEGARALVLVRARARALEEAGHQPITLLLLLIRR